jgi:hypothetical protein
VVVGGGVIRGEGRARIEEGGGRWEGGRTWPQANKKVAAEFAPCGSGGGGSLQSQANELDV